MTYQHLANVVVSKVIVLIIAAINRCQKFFPGGFGKKDCSGFDRSMWPPRSLAVHRSMCTKLKKCTTTAAVEQLQTETGIKYSALI